MDLPGRKRPSCSTRRPNVLEGRKGELSKVVMPLGMKVQPIIDGQYLITC